MKGLLYFLSGCLIIGFILSTVLTVMPVYPIITKGFLISIEQKQLDQAYKLLSIQYKHQMDRTKFAEFLKSSKLDQYKEFKETNNVMDKAKNQGYITGVMITQKNERIPLRLDFVQEKGNSWSDSGWHINDIKVGEKALEKPIERPLEKVSPQPQ